MKKKIFKLNREKIKILLESIFEEVSRQSFMSFTMNTSLLSVWMLHFFFFWERKATQIVLYNWELFVEMNFFIYLFKFYIGTCTYQLTIKKIVATILNFFKPNKIKHWSIIWSLNNISGAFKQKEETQFFFIELKSRK